MLAKSFNLPTLEESHNLFQPLENVKIKTQKQKFLEEINNRLNNLRSESSINVLNEEDATQFLEDFENLSVNEVEKQINKINFGRFVNSRDQINFHHRPSFAREGIEQRQRYAINTELNGESIYVWNIDGTP